eukprot:4525403-Ditylum_brightwellii.AAC.1
MSTPNEQQILPLMKINKSAARQHIGMPAPKISFKCMYRDIIHSPTNQGLTTNSTFSCSLLFVCDYTKYSLLQGMKDFSSESVIETLKLFLVQTGSKTHDFQYFRTDAGTAFM